MSLGGFYQQIFALAKEASKRDILRNIGNNLIASAEHAYTLRRVDTLGEVAGLLEALPLPDEYKSAARFYKAICAVRKGETSEGLSLFESVAQNGPVHYRARALQSIGTIGIWYVGDKESASKMVSESLYVAQKYANDILIGFNSRKLMAILKSIEGDHHGALADLESLTPMVRAIALQRPQVYYDYLNALAVEMGELGRFDEAFGALNIALSSPYAGAYFEWHETRNDLLLKSRRPSGSTVSFSQPPPPTQNVLSMPAPQEPLSGLVSNEASTPRQARVLRFHDYIKMAKEVSEARDGRPGLQSPVPARETRLEDLKRMTTRQKLLRIMDLMSDDKITDDQLLNVLLILEDIFPEQGVGN